MYGVFIVCVLSVVWWVRVCNVSVVCGVSVVQWVIMCLCFECCVRWIKMCHCVWCDCVCVWCVIVSVGMAAGAPRLGWRRKTCVMCLLSVCDVSFVCVWCVCCLRVVCLLFVCDMSVVCVWCVIVSVVSVWCVSVSVCDVSMCLLEWLQMHQAGVEEEEVCDVSLCVCVMCHYVCVWCVNVSVGMVADAPRPGWRRKKPSHASSPSPPRLALAASAAPLSHRLQMRNMITKLWHPPFRIHTGGWWGRR